MTERERWIVYPLLFLALGSALRDKLFDMTSSKKIVCQELAVWAEDREGRQPVPLVEIAPEAQSPGNGRPIASMTVWGDVHARTVYADNLVYRGVPFGPTMIRALPGTSPTDWLRALQQSAEAVRENAQAAGQSGAENTTPTPTQEPQAAPAQPQADALPGDPNK